MPWFQRSKKSRDGVNNPYGPGAALGFHSGEMLALKREHARSPKNIAANDRKLAFEALRSTSSSQGGQRNGWSPHSSMGSSSGYGMRPHRPNYGPRSGILRFSEPCLGQTFQRAARSSSEYSRSQSTPRVACPTSHFGYSLFDSPDPFQYAEQAINEDLMRRPHHYSLPFETRQFWDHGANRGHLYPSGSPEMSNEYNDAQDAAWPPYMGPMASRGSWERVRPHLGHRNRESGDHGWVSGEWGI